MTITLLLALSAFVAAIASALGKAPLWVSVVLLCLVALVGSLPLR